MINPKIEEEWPIKPIESLEGAKDFDIAKYLNDNIYLLEGEVIKATIEIDNPNYVQFVIDWFGRNSRTYKKQTNK